MQNPSKPFKTHCFSGEANGVASIKVIPMMLEYGNSHSKPIE